LGRIWLSTMDCRSRSKSIILVPGRSNYPVNGGMLHHPAKGKTAIVVGVSVCYQGPFAGRSRIVVWAGMGPRGGVVTQRTANPYTPVRFRAWPPISRLPDHQAHFLTASSAIFAAVRKSLCTKF
jgi:hypothetical protein